LTLTGETIQGLMNDRDLQWQATGDPMSSKIQIAILVIVAFALCSGPSRADDPSVDFRCLRMVEHLLPLATERSDRFQGKVADYTADCRGGELAVAGRTTPWVDWSNYWATGDSTSKSSSLTANIPIIGANPRGITGALIDLEYQRMELIRFNLFDNNLTYEQYLNGTVVDGTSVDGSTLKTWTAMRLPTNDPAFPDLKIDADGNQTCTGDLIRFRTISGICNDIHNPAMGSTGQLFARNVEFESTFPDLELNQYAKNRHGGRLSLLEPDPQVISRRLFNRPDGKDCNQGFGLGESKVADCPYTPAPFFNVLAAYWIQFMTHDWFSHLEEARNDESRIMTDLGCETKLVEGVEKPLTDEDVARLGCRRNDKMDSALIAESGDPGTFQHDGVDRLKRAYKTTRNMVTAWWDASQIYGYDDRSVRRVRRDPADPAKLLMQPVGNRPGAGERQGYLPLFRQACGPGIAVDQCDPINPEWVGQEAVAFPDNWSIGLSFFHTVFEREHNLIVDELRKLARATPDADSQLRNPNHPSDVINYGQLSSDEMFGIARLVTAAEIAKIHTIEWTTQLLYDEPLNVGMNSNWSGLFDDKDSLASKTTRDLVGKLRDLPNATGANQIFSTLAAGPGIVGLKDTNLFGSPFNFPEEFITVYRLHPLLPDLIEYREAANPNAIVAKVPVVSTFRGKATAAMHDKGIANWALSMGRQRLGALSLQNSPHFLQNLDLTPRMDTRLDIVALDIIRDRERGVPRFNEFRRQLGLRQLTSFDDFIDRKAGSSAQDQAEQGKLVTILREVYGQHRCDATKVITTAQKDIAGLPINDCLGHPDGTLVDNIEDVDVLVGYLAESTRPHGFAISETQFHVFILNASRRLFSDRFFTESFRPAFYSKLGMDWVNDNGPDGKQWEAGEPNGHRQEVAPLKRVLLRTIPELSDELHVVDTFDPWARDRGQYYSLEWTPRADAVTDESFAQH
jgi:hypothetical protein